VYIRLSERHQGYGLMLLQAAIERCFERGFDHIRVNAITAGGKRLVEQLTSELATHLDIH
ncbi:MAG: GNAT family N-acetyltransferase, partial [Minisyncoccia bacterium]